MPASPTRTFFVARRLTGYNVNITPPGRRGRSSELIVKASDYLKIGSINVGRGSEVRFVKKLFACVVNDTKRVNMGLNNGEIGEGCPVEVVARWRRL
jgi:hypothetical protein